MVTAGADCPAAVAASQVPGSSRRLGDGDGADGADGADSGGEGQVELRRRARSGQRPDPWDGSGRPGRCADAQRSYAAGAAAGFGLSTNQPGVAYQFYTHLPTQWDAVDKGTSWMWNEQRQSRAAVQLAQTGYAPLHVPYVLLGLGQTNDYVEAMHVGIVAGSVRDFNQALIPNSRLVVIPYPYDDTSRWELRLYLEPRQQFYVGLAICAALLAFGVFILLLELSERAEDARERKRLASAMPL